MGMPGIRALSVFVLALCGVLNKPPRASLAAFPPLFSSATEFEVG